MAKIGLKDLRGDGELRSRVIDDITVDPAFDDAFRGLVDVAKKHGVTMQAMCEVIRATYYDKDE